MRRNSTLKFPFFVGVLVFFTLWSSVYNVYAQNCNAGTSAEFLACVMGSAPNITLTNTFSVDLTGKSLANKNIDLKNYDLTITGDPITVNSNTTFSGNGNAGRLFAYGYTFSNSNGSQFPFSNLNTAMDQPQNNTLELAVLYAANVLPVTLSKFDGHLKTFSGKVQLEWTTSAEINNDKFVIETSTEGEVFQRIGEMRGAGTSTELHNYVFTHQTPSAGVNYYRLKQVDFDGTFAYSKVIAVEAPGSQDLFAFPNPARDKITLQYDQSKGTGHIQLFDAMGRRINPVVNGYAGNYEILLPEGLARGIYWIRVIRGSKVQTLSMVKE